MTKTDTAGFDAAAAAQDSGRVSSMPLHWAASEPHRLAFIEGDRRVTYGEFGELIRVATAALTQAEIRSGDRVAILGLNVSVTAAFVFAAHELDAWPAIVNPRLSAPEVDANVALVEPRAIVFAISESEEARAHAERYGAQPLSGLSGTMLVSRSHISREAVTGAPGRMGALLFTSGTTGRPRAVMLSHRALIAAGTNTVRYGSFTDNDIAYGVAPFAHIIGLGTVLMGAMCAGSAIDLAPRFEIARLATRICSGQLTRITAVPLIYSKLLEHLDAAHLNVSAHRLRVIACGGAPLDPSLKRRVEERFGLGLINGYGCTELSPIARSEGRTGEPAHVGSPFGDVEVRLVTQGRDASMEEVGEIWVRGSSLMDGYYGDAEATAAVMRPGGWLATGDLGCRDAAGNLTIAGRIKELIIRSGFNVYPAEVEAVLNAHPAVQQAAVVGRRTADGNEEVIAFVQARPQAQVSAEEIRSFAAQRLAPYKKPGVVIVLAQLPIGPTGKVMKRELQKLAERAEAETAAARAIPIE